MRTWKDLNWAQTFTNPTSPFFASTISFHLHRNFWPSLVFITNFLAAIVDIKKFCSENIVNIGQFTAGIQRRCTWECLMQSLCAGDWHCKLFAYIFMTSLLALISFTRNLLGSKLQRKKSKQAQPLDFFPSSPSFSAKKERWCNQICINKAKRRRRQTNKRRKNV